MRIVIEGDLAQIVAACASIATEPFSTPPLRLDVQRAKRRRLTAAKEAQKKIAVDRTILHRAYLMARRDPDQQAAAANLVSALAGRAPVTEALLETARQIIATQDRKDQ